MANKRNPDMFMRTVMRTVRSILVLLTGLLVGECFSAWAAPGKVYLVVGSDTTIWDGLVLYRPHCHFLPDLFSSKERNAARVMDAGFRALYRDSYGQPLKLTWWLMAGNILGESDNRNVPLSNLMNHYLMREYYGEEIERLGDEIGLHYHTFLWSDYNLDGLFYWNEAHSFRECRDDFDLTLAQILLEDNSFPASFRSGWHYMDNEWQNYLDRLIPFSLDANSPYLSADSVEPLENVYDWSKAPTLFVPFHPSLTNYQRPGDSMGWNVRSVKIQNLTQGLMNQVFAAASNGVDQVACLWAHLPEVDFPTNLAKVDTLAHIAATNYPGVAFCYCTAVEAMQRWMGVSAPEPPLLEVETSTNGAVVTLAVSVNKNIVQPAPFVALKDIWEHYYVLECSEAGSNSWTVSLPLTKSEIAKVGMAVTDANGLVATRIIRFLPDDVYMDNLDSQYAEVLGDWGSHSNAAWGTDSRIAPLASGAAIARWTLPVSQEGRHRVMIQIPAVAQAAGGIGFAVYSNGVAVVSNFFANPLPGGQWVTVAAPWLDPAAPAWLEMTAGGDGRPGKYAVADVARISALAPPESLIASVWVEPADTTATVFWRTPAASSTLVEYGSDLNYGQFSATNSYLTTDHVMTLTGLTPGTTCYFRVHSVIGDFTYTARGSFRTTNYAHEVQIFALSASWKYSTSFLDGIEWFRPAYDDTAWLSGSALFWVDNRYPPNALVQPKRTQMPANPATHFPFHTYYFRTHFTLPALKGVASLSFSNYIDDGAVFYLNGKEVHRVNVPAWPASITNAGLASGFSCDGDAICPTVFEIGGPLLTNLVAGDNVLAVEVHNYADESPDITFGSALSCAYQLAPPPRLGVVRTGESTTVYWNGTGLVLQEADRIDAEGTGWADVPGPISASPWTVIHSGTRFYRLVQRP